MTSTLIQTRNSIFGFVVFLVGLAACNAALAVPIERMLYVTDSTNGNIFAVAPNKSVSVLVSEAQIIAVTGKTEAFFTDNGLFFDQASGKLYFTNSASNSILVRNASGTVSQVSTEAQIAAATGLAAADPEHIALIDGKLYVTDFISDSLLEINPGTGAATVLTSETTFEGLSGITGDVDLLDGMAVSPDGSTIYVSSSDTPNAVFAVNRITGTPAVHALDASFGNLDGFMTVAPNGDLIVIDDGPTAGLGDEIFRVTPGGAISVFLSAADLAALIGPSADLDGGIAFDEFGNFFLTDEFTDNIYRWQALDPFAGSINVSSGELFLSEAAVVSALGLTTGGVDYEGGITFGQAVAEPASITLFAAALFGLGAARRRKRRLAGLA